MHLQEKNRLKTKGIFKRFSVNCYGEERTIEKIRELKSEKFKILKTRFLLSKKNVRTFLNLKLFRLIK